MCLVRSICRTGRKRARHQLNNLYTWMSRFKEHPAEPFVGSGNLHQEDTELRVLKKRIRELEEENEFLLKEIIRLHEAAHGTYDNRKITHETNRGSDKPVNHKWVGRIMWENGIRSKVCKKIMVSDITYIPTDEGWLYLAGVMVLCGDKIVGISMDGRMTKELVIDALKALSTIHSLQKAVSCTLTGEASTAHWIGSGKRIRLCQQHEPEGKLWDNAPMESFWGKLKQE